MTTLVSARDVVFRYDGAPVLDGLDLSVSAGELVAIIGPNGAGKTTCLHVLLGLEAPEHGTVTLGTRDVTTLQRREIAKLAALVPQTPSADFSFRVRDVVAMGRTPYLGRFALEGPADAHAIDDALRATETTHLADRLLNELSGGERQRVHVARALCQGTPLLLLDEPTSNLDVEHQLHLLGMVSELTRSGKAALVCLHDLSMAARFADRVVILAERHIVASGPPSEVITVANLSRYFRIRARVEHLTEDGRPVVVPLAPVDSTDAG